MVDAERRESALGIRRRLVRGGRVAQLARAPPLQGGGRGFESLHAHPESPWSPVLDRLGCLSRVKCRALRVPFVAVVCCHARSRARSRAQIRARRGSARWPRPDRRAHVGADRRGRAAVPEPAHQTLVGAHHPRPRASRRCGASRGSASLRARRQRLRGSRLAGGSCCVEGRRPRRRGRSTHRPPAR